MTQIASDQEPRITAVGNWGPCATAVGNWELCVTLVGVAGGAVGWVKQCLHK